MNSRLARWLVAATVFWQVGSPIAAAVWNECCDEQVPCCAVLPVCSQCVQADAALAVAVSSEPSSSVPDGLFTPIKAHPVSGDIWRPPPPC
jgi:hypothetical protein